MRAVSKNCLKFMTWGATEAIVSSVFKTSSVLRGCLAGRQQQPVGIDNEFETQRLNLRTSEEGCLARSRHVVEERNAGESRCDVWQIVRTGTFDEDHVGTGLAEQLTAVEGGIAAFQGQCICAAITTKSGSTRASTAAFIFATMSAAGITCFPARWPQRFGKT